LPYFQYFQRNPKLADASKRLKSQIWSSVVTILLVEAKGFPAADSDEEPFVKFRFVFASPPHENQFTYQFPSTSSSTNNKQ